jgi:hypothetical protein
MAGTVIIAVMIATLALLTRRSCYYVDYDSGSFRQDTYIVGLLMSQRYGEKAGEARLGVGYGEGMTVGELPIGPSGGGLRGVPDWRLCRETRASDFLSFREEGRPALGVVQVLRSEIPWSMVRHRERSARECIKRLFLELLVTQGEGAARDYARDLSTVCMYEGMSSVEIDFCSARAVKDSAERLRREED